MIKSLRIVLVLALLVLSLPTDAQAGYGARPGKWCGWWMRKEMGVSDPRYNLARSWYKYGSPSYPRVGSIVVWPHHVGIIVGKDSKGRWLVRSGNDGGKVKTRVWNLRGAKFRI